MIASGARTAFTWVSWDQSLANSLVEVSFDFERRISYLGTEIALCHHCWQSVMQNSGHPSL